MGLGKEGLIMRSASRKGRRGFTCLTTGPDPALLAAAGLQGIE